MRYALTAQQQNIWNVNKTFAETAIGNQGGVLRLLVEYDYDKLNRATHQLINSNSAFRLRFNEDSNGAYQSVTDEFVADIESIDMSGKTQAEVDAFFTEQMRVPFEMVGAPLYRFVAVDFGEGQSGIFLCAHHLICDAWSIAIIVREFWHNYQMMSTIDGVNAVKLVDKPSFLESVSAEKEYYASQKHLNDKAYWDSTFAQPPRLCRIKDGRKPATLQRGGIPTICARIFALLFKRFASRENSRPPCFLKPRFSLIFTVSTNTPTRLRLE